MTSAPALSRRTLQRLRAMPRQELLHRGLSAAATWLERATARPAPLNAAGLLARRAPLLVDGSAVRRLLQDAVPHRFFRGVSDPATPQRIREGMPEQYRALVASADRLMAGRFDLLGYTDLSCGDPIDWQRDAVWSRRAAAAHWSVLDPLNHEAVGDSKVVWELNRHQWVVRLAHASVLTGDARYAHAAATAIEDWIRKNPVGFGINWASSLEVSFRLMSWCWTLALLRHSPALSDDLLVKMMASIWQHTHYVRRHLSYYFSPNTHLTGEALGLVYAGLLFPEFTDARQWRDLGANILLSQLEVQTSADGVYFEQSTCYQRYTTDTYLQFLLLADANELEVPEAARARVLRLASFLAAVQLPDGSMPWIGDNDGGDSIPLMPHAAHDASGTLALAAAMFPQPAFAEWAHAPSPEVAWLAGAPPAPSAGSDHARDAVPASAVFRDGGYAVLRSGRGRDAHQMVVDVGPLGCPHSSGHGHADLLSVQCAVFGEPCLVDAGTYGYTAEPEWRAFFRGSAAHSVVMVDGRDQADTATPFGWHQHPAAHLHTWMSDDHVDFVDGWHDAYRRLSDPVTHRRRVVFVKPHYWIVVDDLYGASDHDVTVQFQFAPLAVDLGDDGRARARTTGGAALCVVPFASSPVTARLHCGAVNPPRGWISEDYGRRTPATTLAYTARASMPWRMLTLLMPVRHAADPMPAPTPALDECGRPCGLDFSSIVPSITLSDTTLVVGSTVLAVRDFQVQV
jgi:hypothetical protein